MDLVSSIRKTGSRGGVNFNWEDVAASNHRENYLGHSLKAPVGRWQKGRDLSWYTKANTTDSSSNETPEERAARERKEELKKIKEAEEDALARALGLPVAPRNATGANSVDVGDSRPALRKGPMPEAEPSVPEDSRPKPSKPEDSERRRRRRHRSRSRSRSRNGIKDRGGDRDRGRGRDYDRDRDRDHDRDYGRDRRRDDSPRRRYETHRHLSREKEEDRRGYHSRTTHGREQESHRSGRSHRSDRNRSRSTERFERRRTHGGGRRSTSRERSKSPRRY
ncbi:kinase phosphorylation protein-domain-containing protein [Xylaria intraflava]|nr:kinase phosphorylation protein-domain-containing protein [Xylaria intraflava]